MALARSGASGDYTDITLTREDSRVVVAVVLPDSLALFSTPECERRIEVALTRVQSAVLAYLRSSRTTPLVLSVRM